MTQSTTTMTIRLDRLSEATQRSRSFLAAEAVREFIEINEWQIKEIKEAVMEADAENFATDQEIRAVFNKWGVDGD